MDVQFIQTTSSKLNSLAISNGQIIALSDASGLYYDLNGVRRNTAYTLPQATASVLGGVKLSDAYTTSAGAASAGVGASSYAVYSAYTILNSKFGSYLPLTGGQISGNITTNGGATFHVNGNIYSSQWGGWLSNALSGKAASNHTHSYLPLSGGTLTGTVYTQVIAPAVDQKYSLGSLNHTYTYVYGNQLKSSTNADLEAGSDNYKTYIRGGECSVKNVDSTKYVPIKASAFTVNSSIRYKENIRDMTENTAKQILKLRPVTYDYINKADGTNCMGMIVEEVLEIQDYAVVRNLQDVPDGLDYSKFVPQLIKMIQIQENRINELESKINY